MPKIYIDANGFPHIDRSGEANTKPWLSQEPLVPPVRPPVTPPAWLRTFREKTFPRWWENLNYEVNPIYGEGELRPNPATGRISLPNVTPEQIQKTYQAENLGRVISSQAVAPFVMTPQERKQAYFSPEEYGKAYAPGGIASQAYETRVPDWGRAVLETIANTGVILGTAYLSEKAPQSISAIGQGAKAIGKGTLDLTLKTGLDRWLAKQSRNEVTYEDVTTAQNPIYKELYKVLGKEKMNDLVGYATQSYLSRIGRIPNATPQEQEQVANEVVKDTIEYGMKLIPKWTETHTAVPGQTRSFVDILGGITNELKGEQPQYAPSYIKVLQSIKGKSISDYEIKREEPSPVGGSMWRVRDKQTGVSISGANSKALAIKGAQDLLAKANAYFAQPSPTANEQVMSPSTSVQTGLAGMGVESAQSQMFGEVSGKTSQKNPLFDVEAEKAKLANKPLSGQEALPIVKTNIQKQKTEYGKPVNLPYSIYTRDVSKIIQNEEARIEKLTKVDEEQDTEREHPFSQVAINKIMERSLRALDEGVITSDEMIETIDDYYDVPVGTEQAVIDYFRGRSGLKAGIEKILSQSTPKPLSDVEIEQIFKDTFGDAESPVVAKPVATSEMSETIGKPKAVFPDIKSGETDAWTKEELEAEYASLESQIAGLKYQIEQDPIANYRFQMGTRIVGKGDKRRVIPNMVGLESLISIREGELLDYVSVKQALAVNSGMDVSKYIQKGTKYYNKVPLDSVLDEIADHFGVETFTGKGNMQQHINQLRKWRREIDTLRARLKALPDIPKEDVSQAPANATPSPINTSESNPAVNEIPSSGVPENIATPEDKTGNPIMNEEEAMDSIIFSEEGLPPVPPEIPPTAVASPSPQDDSEAKLKAYELLGGEIRDLQDKLANKGKPEAEIKEALYKLIKAQLPKQVQGNLLSSLQRTKTPESLAKAIVKVAQVADAYEKKLLITEINKLIAKTKVKYTNGIPNGKYGVEAQDKLDYIRKIASGSEDADALVEKNMRDYESGEIDYETMQTRNVLVSLAGVADKDNAQLKDSLSVIKELTETGRATRLAYIEADKERIEAIQNRAIEIMGGLKPETFKVPASVTNKQDNMFSKFVNAQQALENYLDKLSKYDKTSKPYESDISKLYHAVVTARHDNLLGVQKYQTLWNDKSSQALGSKNLSELSRELNKIEAKIVNIGEYTNAFGYPIKLVMTKGVAIYLHNQFKDPTNDIQFEKANGYTPEMKAAISASLSPQEKALAQAILDIYKDHYPKVDAVFGRRNGVHLRLNPEYSPKAVIHDGELSDMDRMKRDLGYYSSLNPSSIKRRTINNNPIDLQDALVMLNRHIIETEHYIAFADIISDLHRVFGNKRVRAAVEQNSGADLYKNLMQSIKDIENDGVASVKRFEYIDKIRSNVSINGVALNVKSAFMMPVSGMGYASQMPAGYYLSGVLRFATNPVKHYRELVALSPVLADRFKFGADESMRLSVKQAQESWTNEKQKYLQAAFTPARTMDAIGVSPGAWAYYKYRIAMGDTSREAIIQTEKVTARTQSSGQMEDLSTIQRGGSAMKLLAQFQNEPNKYWRLQADAIRNIQYGRGSLADNLKTVFIANVIMSMIIQFINDGFKFKPTRQVLAVLCAPINNTLIVGNIAQVMEGWITGENYSWSPSPVVDIVQKLGYNWSRIQKMGEGKATDKNVISFWCDLVQVLGIALGLPGVAASKGIKAIGYKDPRYLIQPADTIEEENKENKPAQKYYPPLPSGGSRAPGSMPSGRPKLPAWAR